MRIVQSLIVLLTFIFAFGAASAGTMVCGVKVIEDGQIPGQSRAEIHKKCGPPKSVSGNNWYYEKNKQTYRLHFNDNDELESIIEERD